MVRMLTVMKLPSALSHSHIYFSFPCSNPCFASLCLLFSDVTCFSHHLIAVSPSQTLRHSPNHAFFLSPEIADLLTAEVWRSIICLIWFLGFCIFGPQQL